MTVVAGATAVELELELLLDVVALSVVLELLLDVVVLSVLNVELEAGGVNKAVVLELVGFGTVVLRLEVGGATTVTEEEEVLALEADVKDEVGGARTVVVSASSWPFPVEVEAGFGETTGVTVDDLDVTKEDEEEDSVVVDGFGVTEMIDDSVDTMELMIVDTGLGTVVEEEGITEVVAAFEVDVKEELVGARTVVVSAASPPFVAEVVFVDVTVPLVEGFGAMIEDTDDRMELMIVDTGLGVVTEDDVVVRAFEDEVREEVGSTRVVEDAEDTMGLITVDTGLGTVAEDEGMIEAVVVAFEVEFKREVGSTRAVVVSASP